MLTISIVLFAFATIIAWEYQGEKAFEYLTGGCDRTQWYRLGYGLVTFFGSGLLAGSGVGFFGYL